VSLYFNILRRARRGVPANQSVTGQVRAADGKNVETFTQVCLSGPETAK